MTVLRWGILGTGAIAAKFVRGLAALPSARAVAVGSRTRAAAEAFGNAHAIANRHGSYSELAADPEVDVVYVATPHSLHAENTLQCLAAGKPVLCEKPFALNAAEGRAMIGAARARGLFLMEAMWTRFNPVMQRVRALLERGALGEVRQLACDFGFRAELDPASRLFDPALGGGALLDVGVYGVSLAHMVFGRSPAAVAGVAHRGTTGVDEQCAWTFRYADGALALMSAAVRTDTPQEAVLSGTRGRLRIPSFWCPQQLFWNGNLERFAIEGNGYHYQAREVASCLAAHRTESALMPLDESVAVLESLDRVRACFERADAQS